MSYAAIFPGEEPKLVPPENYLTGPCWLSFRKYAISKGVQIGRREATPQEREAYGDKRKGKIYLIWAKLPTHPSKAIAYAKSKEMQPKKASTERKEREEKRKGKKNKNA
mmetsp:Transcript_2251/g.3336  ORF Transcript_2251/g.3336 Transcript_2251/m.3336 type:complete len:109 (+) Transcript_2251:580-906(+)